MTVFISIVAVFLYLMTGMLLGLRLARAETSRSSKMGPVILGLIAVLLHAVVLHNVIVAPDALDMGFFKATSLIAWLIALMILLASLLRPVENLAIAFLPLAGLTIVLEMIFPAHHFIDKSLSGLDAHILLSIVAYSLLSIAAVQAVLLTIQDAHLHAKHPGGYIRALPPLQTGESLLFQIITLGFIFLSFGLLSGAVFLENIFAQHLVHKTSLSILAWLVFAILLWGRRRFGWRGRTALRWTLGGFFVLMLAYLGSKLVLEVMLESQ